MRKNKRLASLLLDAERDRAIVSHPRIALACGFFDVLRVEIPSADDHHLLYATEDVNFRVANEAQIAGP